MARRRRKIVRAFFGGRDRSKFETLIDQIDFPECENIKLDNWTIRTRDGKSRYGGLTGRPGASIRATSTGANTTVNAALMEVLDAGARHFLVYSLYNPDTTPAGPVVVLVNDASTIKQAVSSNNATTASGELSGASGAGGAFSSAITNGATAIVSDDGTTNRRGLLRFSTSALTGAAVDVVLRLNMTAKSDTSAGGTTASVGIYWRPQPILSGAIDSGEWINDTVVTNSDGTATDYVRLATATVTSLAVGNNDFTFDMTAVDRMLTINRDGFTDLFVLMYDSAAADQATTYPPTVVGTLTASTTWNWSAAGANIPALRVTQMA